VSDSDLLLAGVSNVIILCFNLKPTPAQVAAAERAKVEVRYYDVIYKLTEDVERAAKGMREPTYRQVREGRVEVITPIKIPRLGVIAGSRVLEGKVTRGGWVKLSRGKEQVFEGRINSLKHFKEDVREMPAGQECGIGLEGFETFEAGDSMETFRLEREEI
jgi:translation initiation factor IF-2